MMATEATSENFATSPSLHNHELNNETPSHDVLPEIPTLNGTTEREDSKQDVEQVDGTVESAPVSVSGGSDTEASKAEASKSTTDEKGHIRTASTVKKFASFKPVSVNKTFLAAKGATATAPLKLGDKGATGTTTAHPGPTLAAPRPRLVAKTGSGLRDSTPRTSAIANGGKPGGAPDASVVWNKNRPAPPPEPKRFTDEELKQRYGIHLATRLQSDDPGKQANWADIDDDDDDWAPESIEWTDGTKITLPHLDEAPPSVPEPIPSPSPSLSAAPAPVHVIEKEIKIAEAVKSSSPAPTQASASPTVKLGGLGSGRAGLVLKGASEKPTLVAKPPGPPTPVKSPWAPLPPLEKVAPVAIEALQNQQAQQTRFGQKDPHGFQGMPPPPAKEIAADDFSRSWRDSNSNASRELYNSQSGRYEPVNDTRRGSTRNDARHPALLQRPSQQDGPAEPSAAFQTHRASGQEGGYGRRRTSSNVSGGSGNFVRRMSRGHDMPPPHDMLNVRRESLAAVSDSPSSPRNFSPSGQHQSQRGHQSQQWQSRASPSISHNSPQPVHGLPLPLPVTEIPSQPAVPVEDPIEQQKKIMQQSRELARKRRQETEAKEEAERKERIRLKLEAMGPPPESKKPKKDTSKEDKAIPTQIQSREAEATPAQDQVIDTEVITKVKGAVIEPTRTDSVEVKSADTAGLNVEQQPNGTHSSADTQQGPQNSRSPQSWQNNSSSGDRFHPWAPAPSQQASRNVWGPPTNDRTLGNGTFNPELSRLPDMQQSSHPGPIGPPNRGNSHFQQGRGREPYGNRPAPIGPPSRPGQPSTRQIQQDRNTVANSGWGNLSETLAKDDKHDYEQAEAELAKMRELKAQGLAPEAVQATYKDTWRQVSLNEDGTRGMVQASHTIVHEGSQTVAPPWSNVTDRAHEDATTRPMFEEQDNSRRHQADPVSSQSRQFNDKFSASNMSGPPAVRGSRFFPSNRDVRLEDPNVTFDRPGSPSPPPPTMAGHPAYDGDTVHPHVSLPRPSPVVKLPPAVLAPIGPPKPTSFAAAVTAPAVPQTNYNSAHGRGDYQPKAASSYQDIRRQDQPAAGNWQDRINTLIGRKNSPPKSHALAVDSSSKNALEVPSARSAATVSLPSSVTGDLSIDAGSVASKPAAEECFEEQEMGSLPVIKVPVSAPALAWSLAPAQPKSIPRKFVVSDTTSADSIFFPREIENNNSIIKIRVPGQEEAKAVSVPNARQRSNPRRGGGRGSSRHSSSSHPRGGRGRDSASGFSSSGLDSTSNPTTNRGRGRIYGSSWSNRNVSTPVHT